MRERKQKWLHGRICKRQMQKQPYKSLWYASFPISGFFVFPFASFILVSWLLGDLISPHTCSSDKTWKEKTILAGEDFQHPQVWSSENTGGTEYINHQSWSAYLQDYQNCNTHQQEWSNEFVEWMFHMSRILEILVAWTGKMNSNLHSRSYDLLSPHMLGGNGCLKCFPMIYYNK